LWLSSSLPILVDERLGGIDAGVPGPVGFELDGARFAGETVAVTAPRPVFRVFNKAARDWVSVDVLELLGELLLREDIEIVIVELPEACAVAFQLFRSLGLEGTEDAAQWHCRWLAQQQMDVFRHEDVGVDVELVALPGAFQGFEEGDAGVVVVEVGKTFVTTEGDEVVVSEGVVSLETARHGRTEYRWVPRSWTSFVHERDWSGEGVGGCGDPHPAHDDETVMNGAPMIGPPAVNGPPGMCRPPAKKNKRG